jgi:hypothetical protein
VAPLNGRYYTIITAGYSIMRRRKSGKFELSVSSGSEIKCIPRHDEHLMTAGRVADAVTQPLSNIESFIETHLNGEKG